MPQGAVPFPFGDCRICSDRATGIHYGVATCEGCKGFYKRSIPKGDKYRCYFGGKCVISPENRNRCKACRFRRCLDQGMAVEAVKMGRIPKVEKERALEQAAAYQHDTQDYLQNKHTGDPVSSSVSCPWSTELEERRPARKRSSTSLSSDLPLDSEVNMADHPFRYPIADEDIHEKPQQAKKTIADESTQSREVFYRESNCHNENVQQGAPSVYGRNPQSHQDHVSRHASLPLLAPPTRPDLAVSHNHDSQKKNAFVSECGSKPLYTETFTKAGFVESMDINAESVYSGNNHGQNYQDVTAGFSASTSHWSAAQSGTSFHQFRGKGSVDANSSSVLHMTGSTDQNFHTDCTPGMAKTESDSESNDRQRNSSSSPQPAANPRSAYSSGLIKMLINTVMHSGNGGQRDKVLKNLERSCSREGLGSGLHLLQTFDAAETSDSSASTSNSNVSWKQSEDACCLSEALPGRRGGGVSLSVNTATVTSGTASSTKPPTSVSHSHLPGSLEKVTFTDSTCAESTLSHYHQNSAASMGQLGYTDSSERCQRSMSYSVSPMTTTTATISTFGHHSFLELQPYQTSQNPAPEMLSQGEIDETGRFDSTATNGDSRALYSGEYYHTPAPDASNLSHPHTSHSLSHPPVHGLKEEHHAGFENSGLMTSPVSASSQTRATSSLQNSSHAAVPGQLPSKESSDLGCLCREEQLRDKEEAVSVDGVSSASSGENLHTVGVLSDEPDVELNATVRLLEDSIYRNFNLLKKLKNRDFFLQKKKESGFADLPVPSMDDLWPNLMASVQATNRSIIGFCKAVPGFLQLETPDQEVLLKRAYYDIWMLTASQFFVDGESYLLMNDDTHYTRALMEQVIGKENTQTLHVFAAQFNALGLYQVEVAILCCIQLTAPGHDQPDLKNSQEIQKLNSYYLDLLVSVVTHYHPATCSRVLVDIFRSIPLLAEINRLQREIIANFSISSPTLIGQRKGEEDTSGAKEKSSAEVT